MNSVVLAKEIRKDAVIATSMAHAGHIGSILSIADIVAVLYADVLRKNKQGAKPVFFDKFVLSKGHAGLAVYSALAELKIIDKDLLLKTYYQNGSRFSGHVSSYKNEGIELSTGSLGQGIGVAVGFALAEKLNKSSAKVYTLVGNGECNEGSVWEAVMFASAHKLDNLVIIVDDNKLQSLGKSAEILDMGSLSGKFSSFGCEIAEIDGHNHKQIKLALTKNVKDKPLVVICNTIKGKGVKMMENNNEYHSKYVSSQDLNKVLAEIEGK